MNGGKIEQFRLYLVVLTETWVHIRFQKVHRSALGIASALAAPVELTSSSDLAARAPYHVHNGWAIYYSPSARIGACDWSNGNYEWVAAISTGLFQEMKIGDCPVLLVAMIHSADANPNHSQVCGKTASVTWGSKTITVGIVDQCYGCGYNNIDLLPSVFQQFATLDECQLTKPGS